MWPLRQLPTRLPHPWDSPGKNTGVGCHFLLQCMKGKSLSHVWLFATPWTAAYQAPPSMGFSRPEYWSGVPLPSPGLGWNPGNRIAESSHVVLMDSQGWELLSSGNASCWLWRVTCILFFFFFWPNRAACSTSVPWPGTEPKPWQSKHGILTTRPLGNSQSNDYSNINFQVLVSHLSPPW